MAVCDINSYGKCLSSLRPLDIYSTPPPTPHFDPTVTDGEERVFGITCSPFPRCPWPLWTPPGFPSRWRPGCGQSWFSAGCCSKSASCCLGTPASHRSPAHGQIDEYTHITPDRLHTHSYKINNHSHTPYVDAHTHIDTNACCLSSCCACACVCMRARARAPGRERERNCLRIPFVVTMFLARVPVASNVILLHHYYLRLIDKWWSLLCVFVRLSVLFVYTLRALCVR